MKRIVIFLAMIVFAYSLSGQGNSYRYPVTIGMGAPGTPTGGVLNLRGLTSGSVQIKSPDVAGSGTIWQFPGNNGTLGHAAITDGNGVITYEKRITPADTAAMLDDYINKADTATMLTTYITRGDTAEMLSNYLSSTNAEEGSVFYTLNTPDTVAVTDNYTLVLTDISKRIRAFKATSMTVTLPPNASVAFAKETTVYVQQLGAGPIVFKPGAGVKIYSEKDSVALNTQYRWAAIIYWGNDNYQIVGTTD